MRTVLKMAGLLMALALVLAACGGEEAPGGADAAPENPAAGGTDPVPAPPETPAAPGPGPAAGGEDGPETGESGAPRDVPDVTLPENSYEAVEVVAEPAAIDVLVNKKYALPRDYVPDDLVEPDVPFIFEEKLEKRKLRREAAEALEALFEAAKEDGILLAGVSGYRSYETQKSLYNAYVKRDGREAADRYSARPGHSEHSTGLAIDVSGIDGKCAANDCFADTAEAKWLAEHAYDYGFIIRYPEGKEDITGYKYEPWHLRYVGVDVAREIRDLGVTLEEYVAMREAKAAAGQARPDQPADADRPSASDGPDGFADPAAAVASPGPAGPPAAGGPDAGGMPAADAPSSGEASGGGAGEADATPDGDAGASEAGGTDAPAGA